ncbi:RHS repeat-associated core domain-containing protein [Microbulbifer sp. TYP-18]|uniref:RHS repeat-associated core domain-containing protein n=1 Tax=Microbulbifer sp. TYP-18 TaxID=3230024 RepID=UPI0034C5BFCB
MKKPFNRSQANDSALQYERASQLTFIDHGVNQRSYQYQYDQASRVSQWQGVADETRSYNYDRVGRLTSVQSPNTPDSFSYDALGNRQNNNASFDSANRITEDNDHSYLYDVNGNRIQKTNKATGEIERYTYNGLDQLVAYQYHADSLSSPTIDYSYTYGPMGRRWSKSNNLGPEVTRFYWSGSTLIGENLNGTRRRYLAVGVTPLAYVENGRQFHYLRDHLGTGHQVIDNSGTIVWEGDYASFGQVQELVTSAENNLRFAGQYHDRENGLFYNYFRDYDPGIGRYLQSDPIGLKGGLNTYAYVGGNSLIYIDPLGLEVLLQTHPVAFGLDHAKVTIIPNNQAVWANDSRFSNSLPDGRRYLTLGAGPEGGDLVSNINRSRDVNLGYNQTSALCPIPDQYASEDELIQALLNADQNYQDNLDYEYFPQSFTDGYNSNSYANGLLRAVGITMPTPPSSPDFNKLLPENSFR